MASMALDNEGSKTNVEKHSEGVINLPATNNTTTNKSPIYESPIFRTRSG